MALSTESTVARRTDLAVKIDAALARKAKVVASFKDVSLAEYLSEALRPIVERDLKEHSRRALESEGREPKGKAPKG